MNANSDSRRRTMPVGLAPGGDCARGGSRDDRLVPGETGHPAEVILGDLAERRRGGESCGHVLKCATIRPGAPALSLSRSRRPDTPSAKSSAAAYSAAIAAAATSPAITLLSRNWP